MLAQARLTARTKEVETEKHLRELAERESGRLGKDAARLAEGRREAAQRATAMQAELLRGQEKLDQFRLVMNWNQVRGRAAASPAGEIGCMFVSSSEGNAIAAAQSRQMLHLHAARPGNTAAAGGAGAVVHSGQAEGGGQPGAGAVPPPGVLQAAALRLLLLW